MTIKRRTFLGGLVGSGIGAATVAGNLASPAAASTLTIPPAPTSGIYVLTDVNGQVQWVSTSAASPLPTPPVGVSSPLLWTDSFQGSSLDEDLWVPGVTSGSAEGALWNQSGLPTGCSATSALGGNMAAYNDPANIELAPGGGINLNIAPSRVAGWLYSAACVTSWPAAPANVFSVWAQQCSVLEGQWPAIWAMPAAATSNGEIDIDEGGLIYLPGLNNTAPSNSIAASTYHAAAGSTQQQQAASLGVDLSLMVHRYDMILTPGVSVEIRIDGTSTARFTEDIAPGPYNLIIGNQVASIKAATYHSTGSPALPSSFFISQVAAW